MKATLTPAQPEAVKQFNLDVAGIIIGYVKFTAEHKHHVVIDAPAEEGGGLYQGHGDTVELAIQQLLERHEAYAVAQLKRIQELREVLL